MKVKDVIRMLESEDPEKEILLSICEHRVSKPYMKNIRVWPQEKHVVIDGWENAKSSR